MKLTQESKEENTNRLGNSLMPFFIILFKESVDNFDIAHKTCSILVWGSVPPYIQTSLFKKKQKI